MPGEPRNKRSAPLAGTGGLHELPGEIHETPGEPHNERSTPLAGPRGGFVGPFTRLAGLPASDVKVRSGQPDFIEPKHSLRVAHPELYYLDLTKAQATALNTWSHIGGPKPASPPAAFPHMTITKA